MIDTDLGDQEDDAQLFDAGNRNVNTTNCPPEKVENHITLS